MLKKLFFAIIGICFLVFTVTGVLIYSKFEDEHPTRNDIKYMVVLGAKVRENGISPTLQRRLDKALNVLLLDTTITVIVSGGKGEDEPVSEAKAMSDYLLTHGVNANRIIQEDQSFSTEENIINSRSKIVLPNNSTIPIYLATSNYHQYRAQYLARNAGFIPYALASSTPNSDMPYRFIREIFAVINEWWSDTF
jgi:uncharacterized SAM-binding protein YcdF (DUF218 family)